MSNLKLKLKRNHNKSSDTDGKFQTNINHSKFNNAWIFMIPFLYYVEISHYNTRLKKNLAFYENTYIYTKNNKGYKLFDHFFVFYSYFFRFFPTFSDFFFYGPMEKGFECLIIFSNQKSIKQFSRYELKKKATVLVYILENDRFAPVHYI